LFDAIIVEELRLVTVYLYAKFGRRPGCKDSHVLDHRHILS
jgi:hypothetical protein